MSNLPVMYLKCQFQKRCLEECSMGPVSLSIKAHPFWQRLSKTFKDNLLILI